MSGRIAGAQSSTSFSLRRVRRLLRKHLLSVNLLLICVPLTFITAALRCHDVVISLVSFLAIIPLSALVSDASDTVGDRWGAIIGGLVNATFGNTVELIVGILAISHNELRVAQSIMIGSILSDTLLVQGFCIIAATRTKGVVAVNSSVVDMLSSLMLVAAMALVLPTALYANVIDKGRNFEKTILSYSRATVAVLLIVYMSYIYFQVITHSEMFTEVTDDDDHDDIQHLGSTDGTSQRSGSDCEMASDDDDTPSMRQVGIAFAVLITSGILIGVCTHYFMESLDGLTEALGITKAFVALIIIPIASNAPELSQVVAAAKKQKVDFAITVIVGSILQIALFVLPCLVMIGWAMGRPMDLYFDSSQTYVLLFAVILVNQVLQDRHYTYLHGVMFLCVYAIISVAYFIRH
ncbi:hypothetical protein VHEMI08069 [[Torrubiella] hemipterigena]|uniref:Vacuolar calcium ion transporter n=1 Tax=[Torrubiella] hemipterigena TaxID=1531966 RepID=A0A0A1TMI4_9HYPO|nr:hypothetical protein VHEMI08069 [[Torrubiella] hemipterigena]